MICSNRAKFRARLVGGVAVLALCASAAYAQNAEFALPSQPLSDSLMAVAKQTGESILFSPQALAGIQAKPLTGQMSARNAVDMLLQGTKLEAAPIGSDGLVVRPIAVLFAIGLVVFVVVGNEVVQREAVVTGDEVHAGFGFTPLVPVDIVAPDQPIGQVGHRPVVAS